MIRTLVLACLLPLSALTEDVDVNNLRNHGVIDPDVTFPEDAMRAVAIAADQDLFDRWTMTGSPITLHIARELQMNQGRGALRPLQEA